MLEELNLTHERPGQLALGMTVLEDAVAMAMLTLLTSLVQFGGTGQASVLSTLGALGAFVVFLTLTSLLLAPRLTHHFAGPALAQLQLPLERSHRLAFPRRAYHFPSSSSFNATLSSDRSATSFLSLAFSSFKALFFHGIQVRAAVLRLPAVIGRRADRQPLADFFDLLAPSQLRGRLMQLRYDLFRTVSRSFHVIRVPGGAPRRHILS
ncbi:MAG: cation:proton antiporter [Verrucomicrobia bacterium]|nr:cation:proton antiporter [Verrucomicrobiota bacterium]